MARQIQIVMTQPSVRIYLASWTRALRSNRWTGTITQHSSENVMNVIFDGPLPISRCRSTLDGSYILILLSTELSLHFAYEDPLFISNSCQPWARHGTAFSGEIYWCSSWYLGISPSCYISPILVLLFVWASLWRRCRSCSRRDLWGISSFVSW